MSLEMLFSYRCCFCSLFLESKHHKHGILINTVIPTNCDSDLRVNEKIRKGKTHLLWPKFNNCFLVFSLEFSMLTYMSTKWLATNHIHSLNHITGKLREKKIDVNIKYLRLTHVVFPNSNYEKSKKTHYKTSSITAHSQQKLRTKSIER